MAGYKDLSQSSFYWAMQLMSRPKRDAMAALYAYARTLDDWADGEIPASQAKQNLQDTDQALDELQATGTTSNPVLVPLLPHIQRFNLPINELRALKNGMWCDLTTPLYAPDMEQLLQYCRQVAGSVGVLAIHIFGRADAYDYAIELGEALQLTNILRDVAEDAERDRLYIPACALQRAGIDTALPLSGIINHPNLPKALAELGMLAQQKFNICQDRLGSIGSHNLAPARMMASVYQAQLKRMIKSNWPVPAPRLGKPAKIIHSLRGLVWG